MLSEKLSTPLERRRLAAVGLAAFSCARVCFGAAGGETPPLHEAPDYRATAIKAMMSRQKTTMTMAASMFS
jgi:hypothetical protein